MIPFPVPHVQLRMDASTAGARLRTTVRLSLLATHFERDLLGLECLCNDAHQANHFLARITETLPSGEWVGVDVQMDSCLSDRLLKKGTAGRHRKKA